MKNILVSISIFFSISVICFGIDCFELSQLEGYTLIECTSVESIVEKDSSQTITLYNGMKFEFDGYIGFISESEDVAVFVRYHKSKKDKKGYYFYKLLINDEVHDVWRIK